MRNCGWVAGKFENISRGRMFCTSDRTPGFPARGYNCIAHAAGDSTRPWWPTKDPTYFYWPPDLAREEWDKETVENFVRAFELLGYTRCDSSAEEVGYEKVAIFTKNGRPTHAARSLPNGSWTSKLGGLEDIEHELLESVEGLLYGQATAFLKRRNPDFEE